ncbi:hypothetical protein GCM10029992_40010 [Glycomyces albus]
MERIASQPAAPIDATRSPLTFGSRRDLRCGSGSVFLRVILALIFNVDDGAVYFEAASVARRGGARGSDRRRRGRRREGPALAAALACASPGSEFHASFGEEAMNESVGAAYG